MTYPYKIEPTTSPYTRSLPWIFPTETTQLTMISPPDTFRVTKDSTMGVELSTAQFQTCQQANGQFCHISTPFYPLANPPTCIAGPICQEQG